jgi:hypothetical protein
MQWLMRGLGLALLGLAMVTVTGCSNENEAAFNAQLAKSNPADVKKPITPTNDPREWAKNSGKGTQGGYPGTKLQPKAAAKE